MLEEVTQGAKWWAGRLPNSVPASLSEEFVKQLIKLLTARYTNHWYPEDRRRGSGFRAVSYDQKIDAVILQAADNAGIKNIERLLETSRYIMFINPGEVKVKNVMNPDQFWDADVETIWRSRADEKSNNGNAASSSNGGSNSLADSTETPASPLASAASPPTLSPEVSPKLSPDMSPRSSPPSVRRVINSNSTTGASNTTRLQPTAVPFEPNDSSSSARSSVNAVKPAAASAKSPILA